MPQQFDRAHAAAQAPVDALAPAQQRDLAHQNLNTPGVWRSGPSQAAAKVDALASKGMDDIDVPTFLRKQAD